MKGRMQISKKEFYRRGGFTNPNLFRKQKKRGWTYWLIFW